MKRSTKEIILKVMVFGLTLTCLMVIGAVMQMSASKPSASAALCEYENAVVEAEPVEFNQVEIEYEPIYPAYSEEDLYDMAAAIYNEAGADSCSDETRRLVGYVILNRVNDPRYPNTIQGVLKQRSQYGRFYWTGIKFADRASLPQEQHAVQRAYRIAKECLEANTIPIPKTVLFQAEFKQGVKVYSHQDGMYFCYAKEVK